MLDCLAPELTLWMWTDDYAQNWQSKYIALRVLCEEIKVWDRGTPPNKHFVRTGWPLFSGGSTFAHQFFVRRNYHYSNLSFLMEPPVFE